MKYLIQNKNITLFLLSESTNQCSWIGSFLIMRFLKNYFIGYLTIIINNKKYAMNYKLKYGT